MKNVLFEYKKIIIITMAQQPCMGTGLLLPPLFEVTKSCAFVAVGDWSTGRVYCYINPDVPARAIWQAVRRLGREMEAIWLTQHFYSCP
jgi:hypothetical protein